jgi:hypothetical protein
VLGLIENAALICKDQSISYWNYCAFTLLLSNVVQIKKSDFQKYSARAFTYTSEANK